MDVNLHYCRLTEVPPPLVQQLTLEAEHAAVKERHPRVLLRRCRLRPVLHAEEAQV